ncbi:hypothetical protein MJT46_011934 [Ovis ammon polii x Ovis aries]|nr:hypothetical protein MJT46_011934 [Ovis ammon polii x Ovis aries]
MAAAGPPEPAAKLEAARAWRLTGAPWRGDMPVPLGNVMKQRLHDRHNMRCREYKDGLDQPPDLRTPTEEVHSKLIPLYFNMYLAGIRDRVYLLDQTVEMKHQGEFISSSVDSLKGATMWWCASEHSFWEQQEFQINVFQVLNNYLHESRTSQKKTRTLKLDLMKLGDFSYLMSMKPDLLVKKARKKTILTCAILFYAGTQNSPS